MRLCMSFYRKQDLFSQVYRTVAKCDVTLICQPRPTPGLFWGRIAYPQATQLIRLPPVSASLTVYQS
jgi:hypothetical protein